LIKVTECKNSRTYPLLVYCVFPITADYLLPRFQWAALQISQLLSLEREKDIRLLLGKLPVGLTDAYSKLLDTIKAAPGSSPEIAIKTFQWLLCSVNLLRDNELIQAVCQDGEGELQCADFNVQFVLSACKNLIVVDPVGICRFSHLSVREYFEEKHPEMIRQGHDLVAAVCLQLLNYPGDWGIKDWGMYDWGIYDSTTEVVEILDSEDEESTESADVNDVSDVLYGLIHIAQQFWHDQIRLVDIPVEERRSFPLLKSFLGSREDAGPAYKKWYSTTTNFLSVIAVAALNPPDSTLLPICYFGLHDVLADLLQTTTIDVDHRNLEGQSILSLAAQNGRMRIVELLLAEKVDVNALLGGSYATALGAAISKGEEDIVRLLITSGARTDIKVDRAFDNALALAAWRGNASIVQVLVKHQLEGNAQSRLGAECQSALAIAIRAGEKSIVHMLFDNGVDVNAPIEGDYGSALAVAVSMPTTGFVDIVEFLIENKADVNMPLDGSYGSALAVAAWRDNEEALRVLLKNKADVNARFQGDYGSALAVAARFGSEGIARLLLENGADVNMLCGEYGSALATAAYSCDHIIVKMLLEHGAQVNTPLGGKFGSALVAAIMTEIDIKPNIRFWKAAEDIQKKQLPIMDMLFDRDVDVNVLGGEYGSALGAAAGVGDTEILEMLLLRGANANIELEGRYGSVLVTAIAAPGWGLYKKDMVEILLNYGADVDAKLNRGFGCALTAAAWNGDRSLVLLLLEDGAEVNTFGGEFGSPLAAAAQEGNESIVWLLLEYGADVKAQLGCKFENALEAATSRNDNDAIIDVLQYEMSAPLGSIPGARWKQRSLVLWKDQDSIIRQSIQTWKQPNKLNIEDAYALPRWDDIKTDLETD
jgi:ankyrin repeat protein